MGCSRFLVFQMSTIVLAASAFSQFNPSPVDTLRNGDKLNQQSFRILKAQSQSVQNNFVPVASMPMVHRPRKVSPGRTFAPTVLARPQNVPRWPTTNHPLQQNPFPQQKLQPSTGFPRQYLNTVQKTQTPLNQLFASQGDVPILATSVQPSTVNQIPATEKQTRPVNAPSTSTTTQPVHVAQAPVNRMEEATLSPQQILFQEQAQNAKYSFDASVTDNIMDQTHVRKEIRDGLALSGLYSYSDGYYKRTVHYKADQNGYRVIKEEVEPIGEGPQVNLDGDAVVSTNVGGVDNRYRITVADIAQWQEDPESTESET